jgi:predicted metal-binding protein
MNSDLRSRYLRVRSLAEAGRWREEAVRADLDRYLALAREFGATAGRILRREDLRLDPRVRLKCQVPRCRHYGTCAHCPPFAINLAESPEVVGQYSWGLLLRWDEKASRAVYEAVRAVETAAFYDGYYLAAGFGSGSCRRYLCGNEPCRALVSPAEGCRFPLLARPSLEAAGFDAYAMALAAGWEIYPAGSHPPEEVPGLVALALVLID